MIERSIRNFRCLMYERSGSPFSHCRVVVKVTLVGLCAFSASRRASMKSSSSMASLAIGVGYLSVTSMSFSICSETLRSWVLIDIYLSRIKYLMKSDFLSGTTCCTAFHSMHLSRGPVGEETHEEQSPDN